ncbi:uncharacterized protein K452DRAFT_245996 [Aplosporella prunicola CBS 121167]|uniref:NAD(P)-binding domain-containing protein n=1 Tax=Aplosporella prunicola CBS 121167 TaxID=1176127 RepID=A0A6A6BLA7_9PEZI|nr:uncharacterized protein K452DRAFT_245996 [Aplosporella prunicola CBS 121167]KAF2144826.1 hypothetical protein K452DRAFT_245996 [Aplosporella prunicola CBS 121167]
MAPRIFLTGTTGYIGGTVLDTLVSRHPEYDITVLLRNPPAGFADRYPAVKVIRGDYDSTDILTQAASDADVVVHSGDSDHEPSIRAIIAGLLSRSTPSFLIHLGGSGIISDWQEDRPHGDLNPKAWSDVEDIDNIWSLDDKALHRNVDKIIQQAWAEHGQKLKTAIVCPPDIYGKGRGPGRTRSVYVPMFYKEILDVGAPFYTASGTNTRSFVHIDDLMTVYLKLVEAAVNGGQGAEWGHEGYYFTSTQELNQLEIARATGRILKNKSLLSTEETKQLPFDQVNQMLKHPVFGVIGRYMFASNSRSRSDRARKLFGYKAVAPSFLDCLEEDLDYAIQK